MASSVILSRSSFVLIILGVLGALFVNPSCSTSRRALDLHDHSLQMQSGFKVTLKHVDSGKNLTKLERLQRRIKRGRKRLQRLNAMKLKSSTSPDSHTRVQTPVHAGVGEFLMTLSIGTPAKSFSAIVDTGSDLIWTQCEPCKQCYKQPTPIFNPKKSSSFSKVSCTSDLCDALPSSKCSNQSCEYYYTYGDSSSTEGILATETFSFGDVSIPKVSFGCGEDNEGGGFSQGAGLVGLGRGTLSLVSQLKEPKFSYCLTSVDDTQSTSTLLMGSVASLNSTTPSSEVANIKTTPLIKNPSQPTFYYLSLEGITVGGTSLPIEKDTFALGDDGGGGLIIDSGTTLTYLAQDAYDAVVKEFSSQMELPEKDAIDTVGLDLCFELPEDATKVEVPKLVFNFKGADLELPSENYMIADTDVGVICLAVGSAGDMSVFGNYQQQNMLVLHDIVKETISFVPTKCDQL
ncbi:PREDICTED: aspartic proteinase nepenthesin-1 [Fragaria vesca subsp. vesca]|uniref:aspartic proteinase nepenthesin-1 n=1 Tax=Fragaria vesca subsp. vesca TaxID=101020 RepID=UPI0002C359AD|nr:PREDICTED: aspartic proteinase nepenthesin-1 [Fragaria vesca subsp. vesca]